MGQLEARAPALGGIGCRGIHWRVSLKTLQNWRFTGGGPPYLKINSRKTVYDTADLDQWLDERRFTSTADEAAREAQG